jgi:hypothetical protein
MPEIDSIPDDLPAFFLAEANGDPHAALRMACAVLEAMSRGLSAGFLRLPPATPARPPKPPPPSL